MKANEMPEKIFLFDYNDAMVTPIEGDTVYVREDAFVEKAMKWLKEHADDYDYTWYNEMEGESGITDKCIDDFRKYMEGE